jgi:hypothetical protein
MPRLPRLVQRGLNYCSYRLDKYQGPAWRSSGMTLPEELYAELIFSRVVFSAWPRIVKVVPILAMSISCRCPREPACREQRHPQQRAHPCPQGLLQGRTASPLRLSAAQNRCDARAGAAPKALINITSDGLVNLSHVDHPRVGFRIDELPPGPEIFELVQQYRSVSTAEMFEVTTWGAGSAFWSIRQRRASCYRSSSSTAARHG